MRRATALFLVIVAFCVFVCGPLCLSTRAIVGVDDAVIAILVAALAACGITFITTGSFSNLQDLVGSLFGDYCDSVGLTPSNALQGVQYGRNNVGKILLNNRFVLLISSFVDFVKARYSLVNQDHLTLTESGWRIGVCTVYPLPVWFQYNTTGYYSAQTWTFYTSLSADCYVLLCTTGYSFVVSETQTAYNIKRVGVHGGSSTDISDNTYYTTNHTATINGVVFDPSFAWSEDRSVTGDPDTSTYGNDLTWYSLQECAAALNNGHVGYSDGVSISTGVITAPTDRDDYNTGDGAILDVGASWGASLDDIVDDTIPDAFSDSNVGDATMTMESEEEVQDQVEEEQEQAPTVSDDADEYQVTGLQDVFPFCLPFDVYNLLSALAAEPEAPSFTWRFYVPRVCDEEFEVDLSVFDTVAQIVRTMELLAFIVGLAVVTRDKFLRG